MVADPRYKFDALATIMITVVEVTREVAPGRRVLGYPGPGGCTVSLVIMVAVSVAAAVVAATVPLTTGKASSCSPP
jgi:hypothetical protein